MITRPFLCFFILVGIFFAGCASSSPTVSKAGKLQTPRESQQDVVLAVEHVLGAVGGKSVDQKGLENLGREIQRNPDAKSAVKVIADSMGRLDYAVKYCPVDGQRYSLKFESCPVHKVPLKLLSD